MSLRYTFRFAASAAITSLVAVALGGLSASSARADLIYVTLGTNRVVTYDGSLGSAANVEGSEEVFIDADVENLPTPYGIARDSAGNVYVANQFQDFVSKFNSEGVYQSRITSAEGAGPFGLAFNAAGDLWVSNRFDSSLTRYNSAGALQQTVTGTGQELTRPLGIAINNAGSIYTAVWTSDGINPPTNNSVAQFSSAGVYQTSFGTGTTPSEPPAPELSQPYGIAINNAGSIYVTNAGTFPQSISIFNSAGVYQSSIIESDLALPIGIGIGFFGDIYVANNSINTISKFNAAGEYQFSWTTPAAPGGLAVVPVPEPSTFALAAVAGLAGLAILRRRRRG